MMNMRPLLILVPIIAIGCTPGDKTATDDSADEVISASSVPVEQTLRSFGGLWRFPRLSGRFSAIGDPLASRPITPIYLPISKVMGIGLTD